jgi:hypothetical protein
MENKEPQGQQIQVRVSDEILKGVYSNQAMIRHSKQEFIFDFINYVPGDTNAVVASRVILSPEHVKGFLSALQDNMNKFEEKFGKIQASEIENQNFGFRTE